MIISTQFQEKTSTMPTVLIVYAHLYDKSYNAAMLEVAKTTLEGQGHKVIVSDLYKMNFNPVMSMMDNTGMIFCKFSRNKPSNTSILLNQRSYYHDIHHVC